MADYRNRDGEDTIDVLGEWNESERREKTMSRGRAASSGMAGDDSSYSTERRRSDTRNYEDESLSYGTRGRHQKARDNDDLLYDLGKGRSDTRPYTDSHRPPRSTGRRRRADQDDAVYIDKYELLKRLNDNAEGTVNINLADGGFEELDDGYESDRGRTSGRTRNRRKPERDIERVSDRDSAGSSDKYAERTSVRYSDGTSDRYSGRNPDQYDDRNLDPFDEESTDRYDKRTQGRRNRFEDFYDDSYEEDTGSRRSNNRAGTPYITRLVLIAVCVILGIALTAFVVMTAAKAIGSAAVQAVKNSETESSSGDNPDQTPEAGSDAEAQTQTQTEEEPETEAEDSIYARAELMAAQYDYDSAIELLKGLDDYDNDAKAQELTTKFEETKSTLVEQDILNITHIFFHILCVDPELSFDKSKWGTQADGYNGLMTTVDEFKKILDQMYDKGYVLVSIRDMAHEETQSDGSKKMVKGSIKLPPGKKAFVMSEDDVCYYEYMKGAGFSDKIVVGDDGRPVNHYIDRDGNEHLGAYDLPSILDEFIDEHPDFSYKGHKACLVFTGYNGILGYRTDESYDPNSEYYDSTLEQGHDVQAERAEAVKVLKALSEDGYDLGSHSWGHRDLGQIEMDRFKKDCDRWERNVAPLIKEATGEQPDIIIYPKGADVGDWHPYASDNARFNYLYNLGFRYFCNVDNTQCWVQFGDRYLRQGRRAIDGYNMWKEINGQTDRMDDLFSDISAIFDKARPTPVPAY